MLRSPPERPPQVPRPSTPDKARTENPEILANQPATQQWTAAKASKRPRAISNSPIAATKQSKIEYWLGVKTSNRFEDLAEEQPKEPTIKKENPKPPPIFIQGVMDLKPLKEELNKGSFTYTIKSINRTQIKLESSNMADYRKIINMLKEKNTDFHTFRPKDESTSKYILRQLHWSTDVVEIREAIAQLGFDVINVHNIKKFNKTPLNMFIIELTQKTPIIMNC